LEVIVVKCPLDTDEKTITYEEARSVIAEVLPRISPIDITFFSPFIDQFEDQTLPINASVTNEYDDSHLRIINKEGPTYTSIFEVRRLKPEGKDIHFQIYFVSHFSTVLQYRMVYLKEQQRIIDGLYSKPFQIFVSYTTRDQNYWNYAGFIDAYLWCVWLWLQERGIDIFYARFSLPPILYREPDLKQILFDSINSSSFFIAFITKNYLCSEWCRYEWDIAHYNHDPLPITLSCLIKQLIYDDLPIHQTPEDEGVAEVFLEKIKHKNVIMVEELGCLQQLYDAIHRTIETSLLLIDPFIR